MNGDHTDDNATSWEYVDISRMAKLLPAWFCERMAGDVWSFGLLLTTGHMLHIQRICDVKQAADHSLWLDVELAPPGDTAFGDMAAKCGWPAFLPAPTTREMCSVAVAQIVCAVELADT